MKYKKNFWQCISHFIKNHRISSVSIAMLALNLLAATFAIQCSSDEASGGPINCKALKVPDDMACVSGGPFVRGSTRTVRKLDSGRKRKDESPVMKINLSVFFMDKTETTVSAYNACVKAGGCKVARTNYGRRYSQPKQPKLGISWFQARQFCRFRGKRLPTEAEWEKAARGSSGELYPWGNQAGDCKLAILRSGGKKGCGRGITWPVASRPAQRYGLYDMAGNAHEWVNDWYSLSYKKCGKDCSGKDPEGPCAGADSCPGHRFRVVRGGSWYWPGIIALSSHRRPHFPKNNPYHHFGFRCARSIKKSDFL